MGNLHIRRGVEIPEAELELRAARAGGPGGQHVNTSATKVELRWRVRESAALSEEQRERVLERLGHRLTQDGVLVLTGSEHRSQHRNRQAVRARLRTLLRDALEPPKPRRRTRAPRAAKERRLREKKARSERKQLRRPPEA